MGRFDADVMVDGSSAAAVRVVVRGPAARRAARFVELLAEALACVAIAVGVVVAVLADGERPVLAGIVLATLCLLYALPLWLAAVSWPSPWTTSSPEPRT